MTQDDPVIEQSNGRDRLIDAAISLFGRDGYDATSLRVLADEAGVSWGLVRFYFGSKDGLRDAAEERVMSEYLHLVTASADVTSVEDLSRLIEERATDLSRVARFLRRAIIEERPVAFEFLKRLMASERGLTDQIHAEFPAEDWLIDPIRNISGRLGYLLLAPLFISLLGRDVFSIGELKVRNAYVLRLYELVRLGLRAERLGLASAGTKLEARTPKRRGA